MQSGPSERFVNPDAEEEKFTVVPPWLNWLISAVLVGVGILVIEFTSDPLLGTILMCGKTAWGDVLTALWLRRNDPRPERGKSLFWFILAYGLCKVMILAPFLAIGLIVVVGLAVEIVLPRLGLVGRAAAPWNFDQIAAGIAHAGTASVVAFILLIALMAIACITAKRNGVKVWVDGSLGRARRDGIWPPEFNGRFNRGDIALLITSAALIFATILGITLTAPMLHPTLRTPLGLIVFVAIIGLWFLTTLGCLANSAADCWSDQIMKSTGKST